MGERIHESGSRMQQIQCKLWRCMTSLIRVRRSFSWSLKKIFLQPSLHPLKRITTDVCARTVTQSHTHTEGASILSLTSQSKEHTTCNIRKALRPNLRHELHLPITKAFSSPVGTFCSERGEKGGRKKIYKWVQRSPVVIDQHHQGWCLLYVHENH